MQVGGGTTGVSISIDIGIAISIGVGTKGRYSFPYGVLQYDNVATRWQWHGDYMAMVLVRIKT